MNDEDGVLYAADSDTDTIKKYVLSTGQADGSLGSGFIRPNEVIFDKENQRIIVSDSGNDDISIYHKSGALQSVISDVTTDGAWGLVIDPGSGDLLHSSHDLGRIFRRSLPLGPPSVEHNNLQGPRGLGYDRWGRLYCVEATSNQVQTFGPSPLTTHTTAGGGQTFQSLRNATLMVISYRMPGRPSQVDSV